MFTGIVHEKGKVIGSERTGEDMRIHINCGALDLSDLSVGESIAVNGVCLTAASVAAAEIAADVSRETLGCTTLADLESGHMVNLEKALLPTTRLGGHMVSGHVDGVGEVAEVRDVGCSQRVRIMLPPELLRYVAPKGSICVDGVSLTVNAVFSAGFEVNLIPHTVERTISEGYRRATRVNIEVDLIARYIERLLSGTAEQSLQRDSYRRFLAEHGFVEG